MKKLLFCLLLLYACVDEDPNEVIGCQYGKLNKDKTAPEIFIRCITKAESKNHDGYGTISVYNPNIQSGTNFVFYYYVRWEICSKCK